MAMKRLFTVFECDNGFIAEIGEAGKFGTVVGMSVSDVTAAAQTALATAKLRQDEEGEPDKQDGKDARVQKIFHSQGPPNASGFGSAGSGSGSGQLLDKLFTKGTP